MSVNARMWVSLFLSLLATNVPIVQAKEETLECSTSDSQTWWVVFGVLVLVFVIIITVFVTYYVASTVSQSPAPLYTAETVTTNTRVPVSPIAWSQIEKSSPPSATGPVLIIPTTTSVATSSSKSFAGRHHRVQRDIDPAFDPYELKQ